LIRHSGFVIRHSRVASPDIRDSGHGEEDPNPPRTFEEALAELEQILAEIEGGELGLEESLVKYERGNFLIHHCRGVLNTAEKQIELLGKSADGGLSVTPLQETPAAGGPPDNAET
jgi:exodeoxyribonuclease VII small subunit